MQDRRRSVAMQLPAQPAPCKLCWNCGDGPAWNAGGLRVSQFLIVRLDLRLVFTYHQLTKCTASWLLAALTEQQDGAERRASPRCPGGPHPPARVQALTERHSLGEGNCRRHGCEPPCGLPAPESPEGGWAGCGSGRGHTTAVRGRHPGHRGAARLARRILG